MHNEIQHLRPQEHQLTSEMDKSNNWFDMSLFQNVSVIKWQKFLLQHGWAIAFGRSKLTCLRIKI